jgi:hypothetical protein
MDKMRFHLKPSRWMYDIEPKHTVKSIPGNTILASRPIAPAFMF